MADVDLKSNSLGRVPQNLGDANFLRERKVAAATVGGAVEWRHLDTHGETISLRCIVSSA